MITKKDGKIQTTTEVDESVFVERKKLLKAQIERLHQQIARLQSKVTEIDDVLKM